MGGSCLLETVFLFWCWQTYRQTDSYLLLCRLLYDGATVWRLTGIVYLPFVYCMCVCVGYICVHTSVLFFRICLFIGFLCFVCMSEKDRKGENTKLSSVWTKPHIRKPCVNDTVILGARKQRRRSLCGDRFPKTWSPRRQGSSPVYSPLMRNTRGQKLYRMTGTRAVKF